ncbi:MAG: hypothetical protein AUH85_01545 [Chloroflexi bacterium 13_1_40CM_4_68_4]|nr:MAG: hypothetical protein AUH85_01545 [Chloroflexi bacterium 13_1_40CM_4_68_4]
MIPAYRALALVANSPVRLAPAAPSDLTVEDARFDATDGVRLYGWLVRGVPDAAAVILVHGFKSDRGEMLPYARFLHQAGFSVLLFDRRGCGESDGSVIGLGATEDRDVVGAARYVRQKLGDVPIGALGVSLGAGIVIRAAAREATIAATVADSVWGSEDFQLDRLRSVQIASVSVPLLPYSEPLLDRLVGTRVREASPLSDVPRIAPRAVLIIHSADDTNATTPVSGAQELYAAAREPKALWIAPSGGHVGALAAYPSEYTSRVVAFFQTYLKR